MAITFTDLHTESGLKSLNEFLSGKSHISGDKISKDDVKVLDEDSLLSLQCSGLPKIDTGSMDEEEKILKGDDVIVELEATLEDLYMGGTMKVWREKNVLKPAPGKRSCNCRNEVYHKQIGPGMFQQMTEQGQKTIQLKTYEENFKTFNSTSAGGSWPEFGA